MKHCIDSLKRIFPEYKNFDKYKKNTTCKFVYGRGQLHDMSSWSVHNMLAYIFMAVLNTLALTW